MKKIITLALVLAILGSLCGGAFAEGAAPRKNAVKELYSAEGMYTDSVGNADGYSYHVPLVNAETPAAEEINREIEEDFGAYVESQFKNMAEGYSLWSWNASWHAYWYGGQLFLLVTADSDGGFTNYGAYGYDFDNERRVTNAMILRQLGVSEQDYMENLREKVQLMFEDMYGQYSEQYKEQFGYDDLLEKTMGWLDPDQPMFIDGSGQIVTIVKIASIAGAEWYYHLATPFAYG